MLAIVIARLQALSSDIMIVANDRKRYEPFDARVVSDVYLDVGTLGGIHAALRGAKHDHCFVVACDMPFLNPRLLERLALESRDYDVLVPELPGESRQGRGGMVLQTLHAIYTKRCIRPIEARIANGERQVVSFFPDVRVRTVGREDVARYDPDLQSFFNANTVEALARATEIVQSADHCSASTRSHN